MTTTVLLHIFTMKSIYCHGGLCVVPKLFDHGILINKGSNNDCVEICKKFGTASGGAQFCKSRVRCICDRS